jgi:hypothetical protein
MRDAGAKRRAQRQNLDLAAKGSSFRGDLPQRSAFRVAQSGAAALLSRFERL